MRKCFLDYKYYGDTLLHTAALEENIEYVQALIKMGGKTADLTKSSSLWLYHHLFSTVTPLHIAILKRNPEMLSSMLQAVDNERAMSMNCREENKSVVTERTIYQLGMWVLKNSSDDPDAKLVSTTCLSRE